MTSFSSSQSGVPGQAGGMHAACAGGPAAIQPGVASVLFVVVEIIAIEKSPPPPPPPPPPPIDRSIARRRARPLRRDFSMFDSVIVLILILNFRPYHPHSSLVIVAIVTVIRYQSGTDASADTDANAKTDPKQALVRAPAHSCVTLMR